MNKRCCGFGEFKCDVEIKSGHRKYSVDKCVAGIVEALNAGGIKTVASCCGHGVIDASIVLDDGRELKIGMFKNGPNDKN